MVIHTIFWDWTGLESCLSPQESQSCGNPVDWNIQDCRGIHRTQGDLKGIHRTGQKSTGLPINSYKYIYKFTYRDGNKFIYFVQLAGSGHMTASCQTSEVHQLHQYLYCHLPPPSPSPPPFLLTSHHLYDHPRCARILPPCQAHQENPKKT